MKSKTNYVLLLCCAACIIGSSTANKRNKISMKPAELLRRQSKNSDNIMDVSDFSVYYDVHTNQTIRKMMPRPWYKPGWALRLPFTGGKCDCEGLQCTCCTGIRIETLKFDRRTCAILTFEPTESTLNVEVKMNNDSVYRNTFSAGNPPPFCVPITVPYLPPGLMDMCMRLFDITIVQQMLHVCMDIDTRIDKAPVLVLHFDCMDMGINGIGLSKPSETPTNTLTGTDGATAETGQLDSDVYDAVTENALTTASMFNNTCAILTFEPTESTLNVEVKMNNDSVYRNTFSAGNPPPFCVPITVPYLPPGLMDMCMRLFDITIVQQMLHVCMDIDTRIDKAPVLVLHFDCMDMGINGIGLSKPSETPTNTLTGTDGATAETGQLDSDVYDAVTENALTTASMFNNSIKYI